MGLVARGDCVRGGHGEYMRTFFEFILAVIVNWPTIAVIVLVCLAIMVIIPAVDNPQKAIDAFNAGYNNGELDPNDAFDMQVICPLIRAKRGNATPRENERICYR